MSVPHWSRPTINEAQVTQFNHLNYEITPSYLFSVPSTIDGLIIDHRDMDGHPQQIQKKPGNDLKPCVSQPICRFGEFEKGGIRHQ